MFEKLELMAEKYKDMGEKLADPDVISDNKLYTQLMKDQKNMTHIIEK